MFYGTDNILPNKSIDFVSTLLELYTKNLGSWSYYLIGLTAFITMFSTVITCVDGYPRTIEQTKHLINFLEKDNNHIDFIIHLKVPKEVLLERAKIRAIEENRKDDENQNTVLTRINEFLTLTLPAIDYINKETKIVSIEVDGNQSREEIYKKITKSLD